MTNGDFQSYLRLMCGFFAEFQSVLHQKKQPPRLALHYHRAAMVLLCIYPNRCLVANTTYKLCNLFAVGNLSLFMLTSLCAVHESTNVIDMGDDIVWMIGICLVLTKIFYIHFRANKIDDVIEDFNYYDKIFKADSDVAQQGERELDEDAEILRWQRICYLAESSMLLNFTVFLCLFNVAICVQPLITEDRDQPFHMRFPYNWQSSDAHPNAYILIYIWQCITSQFNLMTICHIDLLGVHSFLQTALNLKILCIEMKKLSKLQLNDALFHVQFRKIMQFHQHIIRTVQKNNRVFHGTFITQMIASFGLISMSTFETMAATQNPKVAAKFTLFMVVTFIQLSYWCLAGTLVSCQSMDVAQAAFDLTDWHTKAIPIQRNILFMIKRSQKPLEYAAKPFPPFTLATYAIILKQCYQVLALLRESM